MLIFLTLLKTIMRKMVQSDQSKTILSIQGLVEVSRSINISLCSLRLVYVAGT